MDTILSFPILLCFVNLAYRQDQTPCVDSSWTDHHTLSAQHACRHHPDNFAITSALKTMQHLSYAHSRIRGCSAGGRTRTTGHATQSIRLDTA